MQTPINTNNPNHNDKYQITFFGFFSLTLGETIYGQSNRFDIGVEGSPSLIFLRGNDIIRQLQKPTIGFSGGFFFQFNFKKIISLRTNVTYERKGCVETSKIMDPQSTLIGEVSRHVNFDYLTIPILIRAAFGKKLKYFVNAGPYFGYLIKQTFVNSGTNMSTTSYDNTSYDKRFDTGVSTGLGVSVPIKTKFAVSFEVRNNLGLYNVSQKGALKTNSTNFIFGFTYKLGERISHTK